MAEAKKHFSELIRESSEALKCFRVGNALRRDAPRSLILGELAVQALLDGLQCHPQWEKDKKQGLWTVVVPELDVFGQGETKEAAVRELLEAAVEMAAVYTQDVAFYFKVDRRHQYPYVMAVLLSADDPDRLRQFLGV